MRRGLVGLTILTLVLTGRGADVSANDPPPVSTPLSSLPPLSATAKIYVDEKGKAGVGDDDRQFLLSVVIENPGASPKTLVLCPMIHVHNPGEPTLNGQVLAITATGGQRVDGTFVHARTMRFPWPLGGPMTVPAGESRQVIYGAKLSEFVPSLDSFTRDQIKQMILNHEAGPGSTMYNDYFFNFNMEPGEVFQCPHGPNTWWKYGIDDPNDFTAGFNWFDFTFTAVKPGTRLNFPITIHTSETAGAILRGRSLEAYIRVIPRCVLVPCPPFPDPEPDPPPFDEVRWFTDPFPEETFTIDEIEEMGMMTIRFPSQLLEGSVVSFLIEMREAGTDRLLSDEYKRFALDTTAPRIASFDLTFEDPRTLTARATASDGASSVAFVELLRSTDGGETFAGSPMLWTGGDFLGPTTFEATLGSPGSLFRARAVDEAGNETLSAAAMTVGIDVKPGGSPNPVNAGSRGKTPVAILSTAGWSAPESVDPGSLTFGRTGDEASLAFCNPGEDVDGDGLVDLVCHFHTRAAGFEAGDTTAILRGETLDGTPLLGADEVVIVP